MRSLSWIAAAVLVVACSRQTVDLNGSGETDASASSDGGSRSCQSGGPGLTNCGSNGTESCCTSLNVTGGTYYRTYAISVPEGDGGAMSPAPDSDPATVSDFRLDKYLVTLGRFRQFVNAWNSGSGYVPPAGSGKHTHLNDGRGLANSGAPRTYETGWVASDDDMIAPTATNLLCDPGNDSLALPDDDVWTDAPGTHENRPINCLNWYEAYAFCIWDGGFLPSEAEWEYAAAGGSQQLEYPWGSIDPGRQNQYAIYGCAYPSIGSMCGWPSIAPVGTATLGAGRWGQLDLAGNIPQWNLDWYADYVDPCTDCAYLTGSLPNSARVIRGSAFYDDKLSLLVPTRNSTSPSSGGIFTGVRCARIP